MGDLARINTNIAALRSYQVLTSINDRILKAAARISTGKQVTRASDSPSNYYISRVFQRDINTLDRTDRNIERGVNWLQTNDSKLTQAVDVLMEMSDLASQANAGGVTSAERVSIQIQLTDLRETLENLLQSGVSGTLYSGFTLGSLDNVSLTGTAAPTLSGLTLNGTNVNVTGAAGTTTQANITSTISNINDAMDRIMQDQQKVGSWVHRLELERVDIQAELVNKQASLSTVQDADIAKEQMELTKLQILQSTSLAMLAQNNTAPGALLNLF